MSRPATVLAGVVLVVLFALPAHARVSDPYRSQQYALTTLRVEAAWQATQGSGIVVAIVDSGVALDHPDLRARFVRDAQGVVVGHDFVDGDDIPQDEFGHGTMVAGIVAASHDNGIGIAGVAPAARLLPVRVLDEEGRGSGSDVDAGIRWAVDHGADIINLSLEGALPLPGNPIVSQAPTAAVAYAWDNGVVVVAAAGNSGNPFTDYPDDTKVLIVGSTDRDDRPSEFSDSGATDAVVAPGEDIVSTWCSPCGANATPHYGSASGTSFAAPHASAGIALLLAAGHDPSTALDRLRSTARDVGEPGRDATTGWGLIDLGAALGQVREPSAPPTDPAPPPRPASDGGQSASTPPTPSPSDGATAPTGLPDPAASGPASPEGSPPGGRPGSGQDGTPAPAGEQDGPAPNDPARRPRGGLLTFAGALLAASALALRAATRSRTAGPHGR